MARAGAWAWMMEVSSRYEYYQHEDLFGGAYAPTYQSMRWSLDGGSARVYGDLIAAKDLASGDRFRAELRSLYLEAGDRGQLRLLRLGRFPYPSGVRYDVLDGAQLRLGLGGGAEAEVHAGRNHVVYDTRYQDSVLRRAPFSDTALQYGARLRWHGPGASTIGAGYAAFDPGGDQPRQDRLTYEAAARGHGLSFDLAGYASLEERDGSEVRALGSWRSTGGFGLEATFERLEPDRLNPEVLASIFAADTVTRGGGGLTGPLGARGQWSAAYERVAFALPGAPGESADSDSLRLGGRWSPWSERGLEATATYRYLDGHAGRLHQVTATAEKRLNHRTAAGANLDWARFRRGDGAWETAWIAAGHLTWWLSHDLWLLGELENLSNQGFDYNLRTRLALNLRIEGR